MASTKLVLFALLLVFIAGGSIDGAEGNRVSIKANLDVPCGYLCMQPFCSCKHGVFCHCFTPPDPARMLMNAHRGNIDGAEGNRVSSETTVKYPLACGTVCLAPDCHCVDGVCDCSAALRDPAPMSTNAHANNGRN
ncbi:hypothetical protein LINGRAHAP2_LOCUS33855 [Linum grandiflorum]